MKTYRWVLMAFLTSLLAVGLLAVACGDDDDDDDDDDHADDCEDMMDDWYLTCDYSFIDSDTGGHVPRSGAIEECTENWDSYWECLWDCYLAEDYCDDWWDCSLDC